MMNFSGISDKTIFGKLLRFPLRLIPSGMVLPILQGRLKGKKWIVGSGNHGCWLGSYEYEKQILFTKMIREGSVVYDIGVHVGFYTLLASELVGSNGKVFAFEPLPKNIYYLKKHLHLNRCDNVTVIEAAVTESNGIAFFEKGAGSYIGRLSLKGGLEVKVVNLDTLVLKNCKTPPPDFMKIDVEGVELMVLKGARQVLADYNPTIFLATHGIEVHKQCCELLRSLDYDLRSVNRKKKIDETDEIIARKI